MSADKAFGTWEQAVAWLRAQPDQAQLVRDCYYDDDVLVAAQRYAGSEEWRAIEALLGAQRGAALDVGAGRGIASYALAKSGFEVSALEPDPSDLVGAGAIRALAQRGGAAIAVTQEFSERLPFEDGRFDLVFARAVLHHTEDLRGACREFFRVLKPGGRLLAVREHVISKPEDLPAFLERHPLHKLYGGEHAYMRGEYFAAIEAAGFRAIETFAPWDTPINYAPLTLRGLQKEIAQRLSLGIPGVRAIARSTLPAVWPLMRPVLNAADRRPGRLYSFLARKG